MFQWKGRYTYICALISFSWKVHTNIQAKEVVLSLACGRASSVNIFQKNINKKPNLQTRACLCNVFIYFYSLANGKIHAHFTLSSAEFVS